MKAVSFSPEPERILVRATNWVGDAVMSLPALHALRRRFPDAHIAVLARPWVAGLYEGEAFCSELIPYTSPRGAKDLAGKWRTAQDLRRRRFDCAILLQNAFEAAALMWLAGIPRRIGYNRDGRRLFLTDAIAVPKTGEIPRHERYYYLELLRCAGILDNLPEVDAIRLDSAVSAREAGLRRFREMGVSQDVIGVSPGAAYGTAKRWLPESFAGTAVRLSHELGAAVAVFGSPEEKELCESVRIMIANQDVRALNFGGATSLREFIELSAACRVFLTNDSGAMHIASALGVPTIAIFGATDHIGTGPTGPLARIVREPVDCSPCLLRECPIDHRCMTRVTADRVAREAMDVVRQAV
jgi:heptosyltransferase-2